MHLHEYQSKQYFVRFGIPTPSGKIATSSQAAAEIAAEFAVPVVVNAQALDHQRVFRLASTPQEAERIAREIFAMTISGVPISTILIEPATQVSAEYFLGIYGDRSSNLVMIASTEGGNDIAEIERAKPNSLIRETINPFLGVLEFQGRNLASGINLSREQWNSFTRIAQNLCRCCLACDAIHAEINPLGLTPGGDLIALGGKLVIDENALFRQLELAALRDEKAEHASAVEARAAGISYVRLNGQIGCVVSGAGLGMATMDMLAHHDLAASGFFDLGSDIQRDKISAALRLLLPDSQAAIFNIFADKTHCNEIAHELLTAFAETRPTIPVVIRLAGLDAESGCTELIAANVAFLSTAVTTGEAVEQVAAAVKGSADVHSGG